MTQQPDHCSHKTTLIMHGLSLLTLLNFITIKLSSKLKFSSSISGVSLIEKL